MRRLLVPAIVLVALASAIAYADPAVSVPARFTAFAVNMSRGGSATLELAVNNWSTPGDVERMSTAVDDQGTDGLVRILEHTPKVGYFRRTGTIAYDVQFASWRPGPDGGGEILLIARRYVGFGEVANMTRSSQYPLTVIELRVNKDGDGTGTLWPVARINYWDPKTNSVFVDSLTIQPVQLTQVRLQGKRT